MKPTDLKIADWQKWLDRFRAANPNAKPAAAIRIENTILSTARHFGGMTFCGERYTYFEPIDETQPPNPDGTLYIAWLVVREDFLQWVEKELRRKGAKRNGNA